MQPDTPQQTREPVMQRVSRFVICNRLPLAIIVAALTAFMAYPIVNTVLDAAGHRLPGPILHIKSSTHPHESPPLPAKPEPTARKSA